MGKAGPFRSIFAGEHAEVVVHQLSFLYRSTDLLAPPHVLDRRYQRSLATRSIGVCSKQDIGARAAASLADGAVHCESTQGEVAADRPPAVTGYDAHAVSLPSAAHAESHKPISSGVLCSLSNTRRERIVRASRCRFAELPSRSTLTQTNSKRARRKRIEQRLSRCCLILKLSCVASCGSDTQIVPQAAWPHLTLNKWASSRPAKSFSAGGHFPCTDQMAT